MTSKQNMAINLMLEGGLTITEIAERVAVNRTTLYRWLENDEFNTELTKRQEEIKRKNNNRLAQMALLALQTESDIMINSKNDLARQSAAKDVLDRAGYIAEQKLTLDGAAPVQILDDIPRGEDNAKA